MPFGKMNWPRSLRGRLLAVFAASMVFSALLVGTGIWAVATPFNEYILKSGAQESTESAALHVRFDASGRPAGIDENRIGRWAFEGMGGEVVIRIVDPTGAVVYPVGDGLTALLPDGERFDPARKAFALRRDGIDMHAGTVPVTHEGNTWYMQLAFSDRLVLQVRQTIGMPALWQGMLATCLTFFLIFLVTTHFTMRRALQPLRIASAAARQITPRTLKERLDADAQPIEIKPLVTAFNQTLDRLEHGFRTQQAFLASAAHELKTPLALIRTQIELSPATQTNEWLLEDLDRMARQVQQLLILAEVSEPQNYRMAVLDPRPTVAEVFNFMERVAEQHKVYLGLRLDEDITRWSFDRGALFTLLKNLLENAIQHSEPGNLVALHVGNTRMTVTDQGPGVPPDLLPRIFERFWRGAERREKGAGLGLAICQEIATAHQWTLEAFSPGGGLEVRVCLPAR